MYDCSIIIPSKNCLEFLKKALHCVQLQALDGLTLETIVVNDGSSDGTGDYLAALQPHFTGLVVLTTTGIGVSAARNLAVEQAKSDYIAFLDADDLWWPDKLIKQLTFMRKNSDVTFSFTDYLHFNEEGQTLGTCFEFWQSPQATSNFDYTLYNNAQSELLAVNRVGMSCVVAKKAALIEAGLFRSNLNSSEDWDMWVKLAGLGPVAFSPAVTMSYLIRAGSITSNKPRRIVALTAVVENYATHSDPLMQQAVQKAKGRIKVAEAEIARDNGAFFQAMLLHGQAFLVLRDKRTLICVVRDFMSLFTGSA
jgi:glycosyltransferase involved in cell wall biosynthesis